MREQRTYGFGYVTELLNELAALNKSRDGLINENDSLRADLVAKDALIEQLREALMDAAFIVKSAANRNDEYGNVLWEQFSEFGQALDNTQDKIEAALLHTTSTLAGSTDNAAAENPKA